jgi:cold shock CspA family protein
MAHLHRDTLRHHHHQFRNEAREPRDKKAPRQRRLTKLGPPENGSVKFYKEGDGWGFIVPESRDGDAFFHSSDLKASGIAPSEMRDGRKVRFQRCRDEDKQKFCAIDIHLLADRN